MGFLKSLYIKLVKIDDTPQKIALGFGLGVFAGVMPFAGPVAALFLAFIFRVNRAAALLGSLLTNTWMSILSFALSIKVGALIFGIDWAALHKSAAILLKHFHWAELFKVSALEIILPVAAGYIAVSFVAALIAYAAVLILINIIIIIKKERHAA